MEQAMDTWVADLIGQIDRGEAINPVQIRQLMDHKEGRRQLRQYLAMRQLLSGWSEAPPPVSGEKPPLPLSLEQLKRYLEHGTLQNAELEESARRLLAACLPKRVSDQNASEE
jgi:hypothetical protein